MLFIINRVCQISKTTLRFQKIMIDFSKCKTEVIPAVPSKSTDFWENYPPLLFRDGRATFASHLVE